MANSKKEYLKRKKILNRKLKGIRKSIKKLPKNNLGFVVVFHYFHLKILSSYLKKGQKIIFIRYKFRNRSYIKYISKF